MSMMYNFTPQAFKFIKNKMEREKKKRKLQVCVMVVVSVYVCGNVPLCARAWLLSVTLHYPFSSAQSDRIPIGNLDRRRTTGP